MISYQLSLFSWARPMEPLSRRDHRVEDAVSIRSGGPRRRFVHSTGLRWYQVPAWERDGGGHITLSMSNMPKRRFPIVRRSVVYVDGSGFMVLSKYGCWPWDAAEHRRKARACLLGLGRHVVAWVCIQDWMCEPHMVAHTGLTVREHQRRTVQNYLDLCELDPSIPWLPVVQGWTLDDYLDCVEMYRHAGVDLTELEYVGVGSVCRRQDTPEGLEIIVTLLRMGLRVHAFGYTAAGLQRLRSVLTDAEWSRLTSDSAAWSKKAKTAKILLPDHYHGAKTKNCANCVVYARVRRREILVSLREMS